MSMPLEASASAPAPVGAGASRLRLRLRDADGGDGRWSMEDVAAGSASGSAGAYGASATMARARPICRVPWWVSRVTLEEEDAAAAAAAAAVPLGIGETLLRSAGAGSSSSSSSQDRNQARLERQVVRVLREEPLQGLLSRLTSYELAQLSVGAFLAFFCLALYMRLPSLLAAPLLALLPALRVCPEMLMAGIPKRLGGSSQAPVFGRSSACALGCLALIWLIYYLLLRIRLDASDDAVRTLEAGMEGRSAMPSGLSAYPAEGVCSLLRGRDCSVSLADWAGSGNCAVLAYTDGTCSDYCSAYNWTCVRGMDDVGTGACAVEEQGHERQGENESGCLQNWRVQVCACRPPPPSTVSSPEPTEVPDPFDCDAGLANWVRGWSEEKKAFCCEKVGVGCERTHAEPFDCDAGLADSRRGWSTEKTEYCCSIHAKGCVDSGGVDADGSADEAHPCFLSDLKYTPLDMPGQGRTFAESAGDCQTRCVRTPGCARFTWFPEEGHCHLQEYASSLAPARGAIAGPGSCDDEAELQAALRGEPPKLRRQTSSSSARPPPPSSRDPWAWGHAAHERRRAEAETFGEGAAAAIRGVALEHGRRPRLRPVDEDVLATPSPPSAPAASAASSLSPAGETADATPAPLAEGSPKLVVLVLLGLAAFAFFLEFSKPPGVM